MNLQEINSIVSKINNKVFSPIYFLMGEEAYYIDLINDLLVNKVLNEEEKSFNQTVLYGKDTNIDEIISVCKRFPMMSKFQLVIIKEAQDLSSKIDGLLNKKYSFYNLMQNVLDSYYGLFASGLSTYLLLHQPMTLCNRFLV